MNESADEKITEVSPPEAYEILGRDRAAVLIDVRSRVEFDYVGHPDGAVNIPWKDAPDWRVDPGFVAKVRESLAGSAGQPPPESRTLLMLCRSGGRSMSAARELRKHGFEKVINVAEGFEGDLDGERHRGTLNGWRFHGLPWEQT